MALLQELMLVSLISFPVFLERKCSINWMVEVISQTSEFTQPPRDQGEATISGTLNPRPTGLVLDREASKPEAISSSRRTNSPAVLRDSEIFPVELSDISGAVKGGIWSK